MWGTIAMMGAQALMGANKARREQEANKQYNLAQAEMTRYSPWTGMTGQLKANDAPSAFEGAVGGAIQGAASAQGLGLGFGKAAPTQDVAETLAQNNAQYASNASKATGWDFDPKQVQTGSSTNFYNSGFRPT